MQGQKQEKKSKRTKKKKIINKIIIINNNNNNNLIKNNNRLIKIQYNNKFKSSASFPTCENIGMKKKILVYILWGKNGGRKYIYLFNTSARRRKIEA